MPIVVWLKVHAGDLVESVRDEVSNVNADLPLEGRPGSVVDRVSGATDWFRVAKSAGTVAGKGIGGAAGGLLKAGGPMIMWTVAEWFLEGALQYLGTEAGKPAADALAQLGDAALEIAAKIIAPLLPLISRFIDAATPVLLALVRVVFFVGVLASPVIALAAPVLQLLADLAGKLARIVLAVGRTLQTVWITIETGFTNLEAAVDGLVQGILDWATETLRYVLDSVLGPIKSGLDLVSAAWDEWIGRHIDDLLGPNYDPYHQTAEGYWLDGVFYPWGPSRNGRRSTLEVREHPASDAQLVSALRDYSLRNGGLARALWIPA